MKQIIQEINCTVKNEKVLVACSTGVDSMTLLHLVMESLDRKQIYVAHVNHKKRAASDTEETYINAFCKKHNIKLYVLHLEHITSGNFQAIAREKRYQFFLDIAQKENIKYIMLAHHANDNIETIIMRLMKSSSLKGYAGIEKMTEYKNTFLYRPLIEVSKEKIISYAKDKEITYFTDSSNNTLDYTRNRIRHLIIPLLLEENPQLYEAVTYYSQTLLEANKIIEKMELDFIEKKVIKSHTNKKLTYTINTNDFLELSPFLRKQILFRLLKKYSLSHTCIEDIMKKLEAKKSNIVTPITNEVSLIKEYGKITFTEEDITPLNLDLVISNEGKYTINDDLSIEVDKNNCYFLTTSSNLCYNIKSLPIIVRTRRAGDRLNNKLVSDYLTKLKIPFLVKKDILLLCDNENNILAIICYKGGKKWLM